MEKVISRSSLYLSIFLFILLENILLYLRLNPLSQILAIPFLLFLPGLLIILTVQMKNMTFWEYSTYSISLSVFFLNVCWTIG
jgi:uncharacterized membrane protein